MYDVIIVGARCAGSPLALLLARRGARVLVVDRTTFPSDTLNGNWINAAGARRLREWGLLDQVVGSTQVTKQQRYHFGPVSLTGNMHWPNGEPAFGIAPRRKRLDALLVEAAAEAGAEVRQGVAVEELIWEDDRVVGVRGHGVAGGVLEERAQLVVGADGLRSRVAAWAGAQSYETIESRTCVYYSHYSRVLGADEPALTVYTRPGQYALTFPTDDGLTCVAAGWPLHAFARVRSDISMEFQAAIDSFPILAERMVESWRVEPFRGTADLPFFLRVPWGPGWALVGDAGCRVDPVTGQGINDAFRDVEFLARSIGHALEGAQSWDAALADYHRQRDAAVMPIYRFTAERAELRPPTPETQQLLAALAGNQEQIDRFAGLTVGTTSFQDFFSDENMARLMGSAPRMAA